MTSTMLKYERSRYHYQCRKETAQSIMLKKTKKWQQDFTEIHHESVSTKITTFFHGNA